MIKKKHQNAIFWSILGLFLLLSAGRISATAVRTVSGDLIINEFVAANGSGLTDEEGNYVDWIEIYNRSGQPVNLGGWALTNNPDQPARWTFPDMTLGGHEYLVVFASGQNRTGVEPGMALHTNFRLGKQGEFLGLYNILEDKFVDSISPLYPEQFRDVSYGRYGADLAFGYLIRPTPGGANDETLAWAGLTAPVQFSVPRGFYEEAFTVRLETTTPGAEIRYTTDGSQPTETNGQLYDAPIPVETTTTLRAAAFRTGLLPAPTATHTYIFLNDVLAQPAAPPGYPLDWGSRLVETQGQAEVAVLKADYEMDPDIVNDPAYRNRLAEDLQTLPTLSLTLDRQSFTELYTHPEQSGQAWERPASLEWLDPAGDQTFQINAGLRPEPLTAGPKHSFRLLFKSDYGPTKLVYPLFPDSPAKAFDTLLLLAADEATYARDAWLRNSQIAMSGLGAHTLSVHLYLNGLYWGLYQVVERPDPAFMATYLGGDKEEWFVTGADGLHHHELGEAVASLEYLFTTLEIMARYGSSPAQEAYLAEQAPLLTTLIDPVYFSDYLILNWYAAHYGWSAGDWRFGLRPIDSTARGKHFVLNGSNLTAQAESLTAFDHLEDQRLALIFKMLAENPDFKLQLADRLYRHLFNDGALTDAQAQARWLALTQTIDRAIVVETARWGDARPETPFTPETWRAASEAVLGQMDGTAARFIASARQAGYYPTIDPPRFSQTGGLVEAGFTVTMTLPDDCRNCVIYYTTTGSDPRLPITGEVIGSAMVYDRPVVLTGNTQLKARVRQGDAWSALHEAVFNVLESDSGLRITEVMYNPGGGDDYEFIELKNTGGSEISLAGMYFDEGFIFAFPPDTPPLGPGELAMLVSNRATFSERYPKTEIAGVFDGGLSNKGEKITLYDANGEPFLEFEYNDEYGWPVSADGRGDSLVLANLNGDPNDPRSWRASTHVGGSPGADDPQPGGGDS